MAEDALTKVAIRNSFYRDGQLKLLVILLVSMAANLLLAFTLIYMITHPPAPKYFATSINGRITPLYALDEPNQSDSSILLWAKQTAIAAYTYNFVNYRTEIQSSSGFFTGDGWTNFQKALQGANTIDLVTARKMSVSAVATGDPTIVQKGLVNGVYSWQVQMPILVTYQNANLFSQSNNVVTMIISRVSTLNAPRGVGVSSFVDAPANGRETR